MPRYLDSHFWLAFLTIFAARVACFGRPRQQAYPSPEVTCRSLWAVCGWETVQRRQPGPGRETSFFGELGFGPKPRSSPSG
jgi:hypothetical protein